MLVLSRKKGETIQIETASGETACVQILGGQGKVKLGIQADQGVAIRRGELEPRQPEGLIEQTA